MTIIRNLTPHAVNVIGEFGTHTFQSEGNARATQSYTENGDLNGVRIVRTSYGAPIDLPEPEEGVYLIVSTITVNSARASGRTTSDLLTAVDPVRDEQGRIVGCRALAVA